MIATIHFGWKASERLKALTDEEYKQLREIVIALPETREHAFFHDEALVDLVSDGPALVALGFEFEVKRFKAARYVGDKKPTVESPVSISIAIPDWGLLMINEVQVLEDSCTEDLQEHLSTGWRILCVCPPCGQRRPDYIIGRRKQ